MTKDGAKHKLDLARDGRLGENRRIEMMKVIDEIYSDLISVDDLNLGTKVIKENSNGETVSEDILNMMDADFDRCPNCNSDNIEYDINGVEPESIFVYRVHRCFECDTTWEERYDLSRVRINIREANQQ